MLGDYITKTKKVQAIQLTKENIFEILEVLGNYINSYKENNELKKRILLNRILRQGVIRIGGGKFLYFSQYLVIDKETGEIKVYSKESFKDTFKKGVKKNGN